MTQQPVAIADAAGPEAVGPTVATPRRWPWRVMLLAGLIGYAAINVFWQYLGSGDFAQPFWMSLPAHRQAMITPLGEQFFRPLNILAYPWMILVGGLLLGVIVAVPLIVAVLHRRMWALPLLLMVGLIGHAPALALILAGAMALARHMDQRRRMTVTGLLAGLVPVGLYMGLFSFAGGGGSFVLPVQRWVPYSPFLVALLAALLLSVALVTAARWLRPMRWAVIPTLLVVSAVPVGIFYWKIGPAELNYTLLASRVSPGGNLFEPALMGPWRQQSGLAPTASAAQVRKALLKDLSQRQHEWIDRCDSYLARYGRSVRCPSVLWLKAQAMSLQLDQDSLGLGVIRYVETSPAAPSQAAWLALSQQYAASPQAALANWRLGQLALRAGQPRQARGHLQAARDSLADIMAAKPRQVEVSPRIFAPLASLPPQAHYEQALLDVEQLLWLVDSNNVLDDPAAAEALAAFMNIDPLEGHYYQRLCDLLSDKGHNREATAMGNNIKLAIARATADTPARIEALMVLSQDRNDADAAIEANYELGCLALHERALAARHKLQGASIYLRAVCNGPPSPWQADAQAKLAALGAQ